MIFEASSEETIWSKNPANISNVYTLKFGLFA